VVKKGAKVRILPGVFTGLFKNQTVSNGKNIHKTIQTNSSGNIF
jgi:hypothetical protein